MTQYNTNEHSIKFRGRRVINTMGQEIKNKPVFKKNYKYIIGIDPGVNTGIAIWIKDAKEFHCVQSIPIHRALGWLQEWAKGNYKDMFVRIEDARKRKWFGKSGREQLQGAGSIKRDCKIWQDFLKDELIDFELVAPKNNKTKLDAKQFEKITGWKERTNEHARDAAMLCFGF